VYSIEIVNASRRQ
ncbi:hypothetical protein ACN38_g13169, partial [Penicillium nordicum]